jgi:CDP-glucose 4,6-dehydratase
MFNGTLWHGQRVFLTGHTGFKGAWLTLLLHRLGATVFGYSLPPSTHPSLFDLAGLEAIAAGGYGDVREPEALRAAMQEARPDLVLHLAAQALVRRSYADPIETFAANAMGTVHVLEAMRHTPSARAAVIVTTDKCYDFDAAHEPCREGAALGGADPYSASKAAAELAVACYRRSYFGGGTNTPSALIATARAGNVIGGGDWSPDRIVTDLVAAFQAGRSVPLRYPAATRPWQHVLDALCGYLMLAERLLEGEMAFAEAWNFGPSASTSLSVQKFVETFAEEWGIEKAWHRAPGTHPHENAHQPLDSRKARDRLGWHPRMSIEDAVRASARWHLALRDGASARQITERCIDDHIRQMTAATTPGPASSMAAAPAPKLETMRSGNAPHRAEVSR